MIYCTVFTVLHSSVINKQNASNKSLLTLGDDYVGGFESSR